MTRFRSVSIAVLFTMVCSTGLVRAECTPAVARQISSVRDAWKTSWNAKQLGGVIKLYTRDATYLSSDVSQIDITSVKLDCSGDSGTYTQKLSSGKNIEGQYLVALKLISGGGMGGKAALALRNGKELNS